ncbi:MAG: type III-A CRISPR-associated RAMP protein Csm5 [Candidatus Eremiobacterota bacterium]
MSSKYQYFTYTVEVLSPTHIGIGEKLREREYFVSSGNLYAIDIKEFLSSISERKDPENFIKTLSDVKWDTSKENLYKYIIPCNYNPQEILTHIKSIYHEPYMTGSSIKGAIRTCLLQELLSSKERINFGKEKLKKAFKQLSGQERKKISVQISSDIGGEIERYVFGGKNGYSSLRALQISDTGSIPSSSLQISEIKVMSANLKNGLAWKKFKLYIETIKPSREEEKKLEGTIKIDNYLLQDIPVMSERLGYTDQKDVIKNFSQLCRKYSNEKIKKEIKFFNDCDLKELAIWYKKLEDLKLAENQFLLQVGWGTGFESKTVTHTFSDDMENIRRYFSLGKRKIRIHLSCDSEVSVSYTKKDTYFCPACRIDQLACGETIVIPFPKTRRIIFAEGKPLYPPGWIKISVNREQ